MKKLLKAFLDANALRWSLLTPLSYAVGAGAYMTSSFEPNWSLILGPVIALLSVQAILKTTSRHVLLSTIMVAFGLGAATAKLRTILVESPVLWETIEFVTVEGVLDQIEFGDKGNRLVIRPSAISSLSKSQTPELIRVTQKKQTQLAPGRPVTCLATLSPPPYSGVPGDYEFNRQAYFRKLGAVGYVLGQCDSMPFDLTERGLVGIFRDHVGAIRRKTALHVYNASGEAAGGMAAAMITGDRSLMRGDEIEALRQSGLAHLLAISGLHMSLAGGVFFFFSRLLFISIEPVALRIPPDRVAAMVALGGCLIYFILSGGSVATQRAFVMASAAFSAKILDKNAISTRNLGAAMIVVTALQPESVVTPGFQMSFAATGALISLYELRRVFFALKTFFGRIARFFLGVATVSVTASLATAPFAAFHFGRVATYSIPANVAASPVISFWTAPSAAFAGIVAPIHQEGIFLRSFGYSLEVVLAIALATSGDAPLPLNPMTGEVLLLFVAGIAAFVVLRGRSKWLAMAPITIAGVLWSMIGQTAILVDRSGHLFFRTEQGWMLVEHSRSTYSGLPPLQIERSPAPTTCEHFPCTYQLNPEGWLLEISQPFADEKNQIWLVWANEGRSYKKVELSALKSTRIALKDDRMFVQSYSRSFGARPWSPL